MVYELVLARSLHHDAFWRDDIPFVQFICSR